MATYLTPGMVFTDISGSQSQDPSQSIVVQPDGKFIVAGGTYASGVADFALVRYTANGNLDTSFNGTGKLTIDLGRDMDPVDFFWEGQFGVQVALQPDGKIVFTGMAWAGDDHAFVAVRCNADGSLDTTFNGTGKVVISIGSLGTYYRPLYISQAIAVQPDGKILIGGTVGDGELADFAMMRLNADGSLDSSFNGTGTALADLSAGSADYVRGMTLQPDGKIVLAGMSMQGDSLESARPYYDNTDFAVARFNADGTPDTDFNGTGVALADLGGTIYEEADAVTVQDDGKVVVAGFSDNDFVVMRYNTDGTLDAGFGSDGSVTTGIVSGLYAEGRDVVVQPDGKILVAGRAAIDSWGETAFAIVRYNADGTLDTSFNGTGKRVLSVGDLSSSSVDVALQADGRILVTGPQGWNFTVLCLNPDGSLDEAFGTSTSLTGTQGADDLQGDVGDDTITGLGGTDTLDGGDGSDLYVIGSPAEHTAAEFFDTGSSGVDEVRFTATIRSALKLLAGDTGIERVVVGTGTDASASTSGTAAINVDASQVTNGLHMIGNAGANALIGSAHADTLEGGAGADKLTGGSGNDIYVIDHAKDAVIEGLTGGTDLAMASVSYILAPNVENLTLTGSASVNGTGNAAANAITGNAAVNHIDGRGGLDVLDGGEGSDVYVVGAAADHPAAEFADSGSSGADEIRFVSTRASSLTLFAGDIGIESVTMTGKAALNVHAGALTNGLSLLGNMGNNVITGTAFDDTLDGGGGNDVLTGGAGEDVFRFTTLPGVKNKDTIVDFESGVETMCFSLAVFTGLGGTGTLAYDPVTGTVSYDADGAGSLAAVPVVVLGTLTHPPALSAGDLQLIA